MNELESISQLIRSQLFDSMSEDFKQEVLSKQKALLADKTIVQKFVEDKIKESVNPIIEESGYEVRIELIKKIARPSIAPKEKQITGIKVTFADGTIINDANTEDTLVKVLEKIGLRKKIALIEPPIQINGCNLVGTIPGKEGTQRKVDDWYVYVDMPNKEKINVLKRVDEVYSFGLKIEPIYGMPKMPEQTSLFDSIDNEDVIIRKNSLAQFVKAAIDYFYEKDDLKKMMRYSYENQKHQIGFQKRDKFNLGRMFMITTVDDIQQRNRRIRRWFTESYILKGRDAYLSTQWADGGKDHLQFNDFVSMILYCYPGEYSILREGSEFLMKKKR